MSMLDKLLLKGKSDNGDGGCGGDGYGRVGERSGERGFTIVEVMIVIGIGALVAVLVLVAATALQRNARNSQRRTDIGAIRGQLIQVQSNNNGTLPATTTKFDSDVLSNIEQGIYKVDTSVGTIPATGVKNAEDSVYYVIDTAVAGTEELPDPSALHIFTNKKCANDQFTSGNPTTGSIAGAYEADLVTGATVVANSQLQDATSRSFAIVYQLEGESTARCEDNA